MAHNTGKRRLGYLDIAKGIGILLVIMGHVSSKPYWMNRIIFSVHMPLFFVLSGYTYNKKHADDPVGFVKSNAKALLIPYGLTCVILIITQVLKAAIGGGDPGYEFVKWLAASLYGAGTLYPSFFEEAGIPMTYIGAIWFLLALFFAKVMFNYIMRSRTPFFWTMLIFFIGQVTMTKIGWFPFSIQAGMGALPFLYIGYYIKEKDLFRFDAVPAILKILMLAAWIYCAKYCGELWMVNSIYTNGFLDMIGGICGTFVIVYLSQLLEKVPGIRSVFLGLGRITLGIMCAHLLILDAADIDIRTMEVTKLLNVSYFAGEVLVVFVLTAAATAVLYVIPWLNKWFFPVKIGGSRQVKI